MRIFEPTLTDVHLLIPKIRQMIQAYRGHLKPNPVLCVSACMKAVDNPHALLLFAMNDRDELVGYFMGALTREMFSGVSIASQVGTMLLPKYAGYLTHFLNRFYSWAQENRAKRVYIHFSGQDPRRDAVLARRGYEPAEVHYMKEVHYGR